MSQLLATFQSRKRTRITLCLSHKKMNRSPKTSHCLKLPAWSLMQTPNVGSWVLCVRIDTGSLHMGPAKLAITSNEDAVAVVLSTGANKREATFWAFKL